MTVHKRLGVHHNGGHSGLPNINDVLRLSLVLNVIFIFLLLIFWILPTFTLIKSTPSQLRTTAITWHGGHPVEKHGGSCVCNDAQYCMCTPSLAIDLIIVSSDMDHLWLVRRKDTNQLATMGGFVQVGETTEHAVIRELLEETGLVISNTKASQIVLAGVYSDPRRDNRRHTVSVVYAVHLSGDVHPKPADDVKEVIQIPMDDIENYEYFADHKTILLDYRQALREGKFGDPSLMQPYSGDYSDDVTRTTCYYSNLSNFVPT